MNSGNALVIDSMDRLVVYDLHKGCDFYDLPGMVRSVDVSYANNREDGNPYCNQGVALLANASYVATVSKHGVIHILRTRDGSRAGSLKTSGTVTLCLNSCVNSLRLYREAPRYSSYSCTWNHDLSSPMPHLKSASLGSIWQPYSFSRGID